MQITDDGANKTCTYFISMLDFFLLPVPLSYLHKVSLFNLHLLRLASQLSRLLLSLARARQRVRQLAVQQEDLLLDCLHG